MAEQQPFSVGIDPASGFLNSVYKPDVLQCLANLSNDEVFTPPDVVNEILDMLPQELFSNPEARFLDPVSKSGVFLREIAKRLLEGLKDQIPDLQTRLDHIFHKQLFGIAITELTALMSRRSVYCSKNANSKWSVSTFDTPEGNIAFKRIKHTWEGNSCKYCGASKSEYDRSGDLETHAYQFIHPGKVFENMKFDVIIGNPPYQLSDGGAQASAKPIYNYFIEAAKKLNPRYLTMIIPARWYSGGKNLDSFRDSMLADDRLAELHDFQDASECFSGVEIKGGVCYFLWKRDTHGPCKVYSHKQNQVVSQMQRPLLENGCTTFIRHNEAITILRKIQSKNEASFSTIVRPAMTFGLRTYVKDFESKTPRSGYVKVYANHTIGYMPQKDVPTGKEFIDCWKVIIPEAIGIGDMTKDIVKPILSEPGAINTETYIMNGPYKSKEEAQNAIGYVKTKFFHFLLGLRKITQHTTARTYTFIPMQDFSEAWTDEKLYKKYGLSGEEIAFIESMIRPME